VACPYFLPQVPLETGPWVHAPRWPLGAAYTGICQACPDELFEPSAECQETLCNRGYARGICERFPPSAPFDAVRFSVLEETAESPRFVWILEQEHTPAQFGVFEYDATLGKVAHNGLAGRGQVPRVSQSFDAAPGGLCALKRPITPGLPGVFDRQAEIFALSYLAALSHLAATAGLKPRAG
jgi:hypothetical protein